MPRSLKLFPEQLVEPDEPDEPDDPEDPDEPVPVLVLPVPASEPKTALTHVSISEQPRFTQFCACAIAASP